MKKFRVIIAGSRNCPEDSAILKARINSFFIDVDRNEVEIVSGCCRGGDKLGENYAKEQVLPIKRFPADWNKYGKAAGPIRNKEMAQYGTHLIALHNGKSPGTSNMIKLAKQQGLQIAIIEI